jgi:hypothetical protein
MLKQEELYEAAVKRGREDATSGLTSLIEPDVAVAVGSWADGYRAGYAAGLIDIEDEKGATT